MTFSVSIIQKDLHLADRYKIVRLATKFYRLFVAVFITIRLIEGSEVYCDKSLR